MSNARWQAGLWAALLLPLLVFLAGPGWASVSKRGVVQRGDYLGRPEVQAFIDQMAARHGFDPQRLTGLFAQARRQERVLEAISRPAEAKPWYQYRPIFLTPARIEGGVEYWSRHEALLSRAGEAFGVEPEYLVAIIGVETYYGRRTGGFPVFDTLVTLGFDYPPRSGFFRRELEQYLLLARDESLDPLSLKGSYAGAMGKGQFIASSYRSYAVDFDGDGRRDLWGSAADAIGSVANYFERHGWEQGGAVAVPAASDGGSLQPLLEAGLKPSLTLDELAARGVRPTAPVPPGDPPVALIELQGAEGPEYWIGFNNFYVITRYNRSPLYAMAVHQLAQEIRQARDARLRTALR